MCLNHFAMTMLTKHHIEELAKVSGSTCISIFIPTHPLGGDIRVENDQLSLKNQIKAITSLLREKGLDKEEIKEKLSPLSLLLDDKEFWKNQSYGLAIFLTDHFLETHSLPISFKPYIAIGSSFYLKPLMPAFVGNGRFMLLSLKLHDVSLFEVGRDGISKVYLDETVPRQLEEVVGSDYKQKDLQFRSLKKEYGSATSHGHGEGKEERKGEILKYFRAINKGILRLLHSENLPLVVACADYLYPIYRQANTYKFLSEKHVSCDPSGMDLAELHQKSWDLMAPHFLNEQEEKIALFKQFEGKDRTSSVIETIIPAAFDGTIAALFLQKNTDVWGTYNPETREVKVMDQSIPSSVSLTNMAAIKVFLKGGKVYLFDKEQMPNPHSIVNALYRF